MAATTAKPARREKYDFSQLQIENNVPIPEGRVGRKRDTGLAATLRQIPIGASFVIPADRRSSAVSTAASNGIQVKTALLAEDVNQVRVWKTGYQNGAEPTAPTPKSSKSPLKLPKLSVAKK